MENNFCAFILSHGRPDNVITYETLNRHGYTGPIYIIIDNEDKTADKYYEKYGDKVIMFNKAEVASRIDEGDNFNDRRAIIYARNACFDIAKNLGFEYFIQLDDDYTDFRYRCDDKQEYNCIRYDMNIEKILSILLEYYKKIPASSIAMSQGGDFIGGESGLHTLQKRRKCMNTFICSTNRRFYFSGRINEDVNTYVNLGSIGYIFFTIPHVSIEQKDTQKNKGGMTDIYIKNGTYIKSFYTVMYSPSCVKIGVMGNNYKRIHHSISWDNAVPVIISEDHRRSSNV